MTFSHIPKLFRLVFVLWADGVISSQLLSLKAKQPPLTSFVLKDKARYLKYKRIIVCWPCLTFDLIFRSPESLR